MGGVFPPGPGAALPAQGVLGGKVSWQQVGLGSAATVPGGSPSHRAGGVMEPMGPSEASPNLITKPGS